jgi:hypothetical protein
MTTGSVPLLGRLFHFCCGGRKVVVVVVVLDVAGTSSRMTTEFWC